MGVLIWWCAYLVGCLFDWGGGLFYGGAYLVGCLFGGVLI